MATALPGAWFFRASPANTMHVGGWGGGGVGGQYYTCRLQCVCVGEHGHFAACCHLAHIDVQFCIVLFFLACHGSGASGLTYLLLLTVARHPSRDLLIGLRLLMEEDIYYLDSTHAVLAAGNRGDDMATLAADLVLGGTLQMYLRALRAGLPLLRDLWSRYALQLRADRLLASSQFVLSARLLTFKALALRSRSHRLRVHLRLALWIRLTLRRADDLASLPLIFCRTRRLLMRLTRIRLWTLTLLAQNLFRMNTFRMLVLWRLPWIEICWLGKLKAASFL